MTKPKIDWFDEVMTALFTFVIAAIVIVLFWLALVHICGVEDPGNVIGFLGVFVVTMRVLAGFLPMPGARERMLESRRIEAEGRKVLDEMQGRQDSGHATWMMSGPDVLLHVVEALGCEYHRDMEVVDVTRFLRDICGDYASKCKPGRGMYYIHRNEDGNEVYRLSVVGYEDHGEMTETVKAKTYCEFCSKPGSGVKCAVCGRIS